MSKPLVRKHLKLTTDPEEKYYFHITPEDWGDKVKLHPRSDGDYRSGDEPNISRICVCPTIAGCISAVWSCYGIARQKHVSVYRTLKQKHAVTPIGVADSHITGEVWLLKPAMFVRVGKIDPLSIFKLGKLNSVSGSSYKKDLREQSKAMTKLRKAGCLLRHDNKNN